jgi:hypothetical protein
MTDMHVFGNIRAREVDNYSLMAALLFFFILIDAELFSMNDFHHFLLDKFVFK